MKIGIIGASGKAGSLILKEAVDRPRSDGNCTECSENSRQTG